jgi:probable rRNA maturation factor
MPLEVVVHNPCHYPGLGIVSLRRWAAELVESLAPQATTLGVLLTSDRQMRLLNRRYRDRDETTDVLSFPGESTAEGWHLGDVVISAPAARRQAGARGHGLGRELRALLLHGVLHCLGHDHEVDDGQMRRLERRLRKDWLSDDRV